ncbi:MAG: precorrin-6y C5,15-methyltransferase (decarboxylating) subunit CbiE [Desulfobacula sp.]|nr:precorrin-6y C5,15-methyltransferase (decarboxylating) subunit CbiE [Desulfobacula sp.]
MSLIDIIGMGQSKSDLTQKHLDIINKCDVIIAGKRHLAMFDLPDIEKIPIKSSMQSIVDIIKKKIGTNKIVVLASGDPLFYGIGSTLIRYFDKKQINIHSNIASVSAAFAAIKEPWHDAKIISLHGKNHHSFSFSTLARENKIAFLTDKKNNPQYIAGQLIQNNLLDFKFCVLENIGDKKKETITWFKNLDQVKKYNFAQPNIVILKNRNKETINVQTHFGMEDSEFKHSKGLITKSEIRSVTLSKLKLIKKNHLLWDIGSGSGSIAIEAALQIPEGYVYAMEKNQERILDIDYNIKKFNCPNIKVLNTEFPQGVDHGNLGNNTPDRIFIGGGGKQLGQIIKFSCEKLAPSGIIVVNTVVVQNFQSALDVLKQLNFNPQAIQIQVSRSRTMSFGDRFEALNPVWIISGRKPKTGKYLKK